MPWTNGCKYCMWKATALSSANMFLMFSRDGKISFGMSTVSSLNDSDALPPCIAQDRPDVRHAIAVEQSSTLLSPPINLIGVAAERFPREERRFA